MRKTQYAKTVDTSICKQNRTYTVTAISSTKMHEVVAPCGGVDNNVPKLHATQSEPLD